MAVQWPPWSGGGGGGGVASVNGDVGPAVVLDAGDVGAIPNVYANADGSTRIPYYLANSGVQGVVIMDINPTSGTVPKRQASGHILVANDPTFGTQATNKNYVDGLTAALDARLDALESAGFIQGDGSVTDLVSKTAAEMAGITPDATTVYAVTP